MINKNKQEIFMQTLLKQASREDFAVWCRYYIKLNGKPFSFKGHEYLIKPYEKVYPYEIHEKPSQVGITTMAILKAIWLCAERDYKLIYFFPTMGDVNDFSNERLNKYINESEYLLKKLKSKRNGIDNVGLKSFGNGSLYLRGLFDAKQGRDGQSGTKVKSIDAGAVIFDELDEMQSLQIEAAEHRTDHHAEPYKIYLSTPTAPNLGINALFNNSTQNYYIFRCAGCGEDICLEKTFPDCLERQKDGSVKRICPKCKKEIDLETGRWVEFQPSKERVGFHYTQLWSKWINPKDILDEFENVNKNKTLFYNHRIGIPYIDIKNKITESQVLACRREYDMKPNKDDYVVMGVDTGRDWHYFVMRESKESKNRFETLDFGSCADAKQISFLMEKWNVKNCVIDAGGNYTAAWDFINANRGRVLSCNYHNNDKELMKEKRDRNQVAAYRTGTLDITHDLLIEQGIALPNLHPEEPKFKELITHFCNIIKKEEINMETGAKSYRWIRSGADHLRHAFNYAYIANQSRVKLGSFDLAFELYKSFR
jgi:hypothetical protein